MPLSTLKVVIDDLVSPLPRFYDVMLELGGKITTQSFFIPSAGSGSVEFPIDAQGSGRLELALFALAHELAPMRKAVIIGSPTATLPKTLSPGSAWPS